MPIHDYDYIVGPHYYLKNNHWVAIIIDMKLAKFQLIDPLEASEKKSQIFFDSWVEYYNKRNDFLINKWIQNAKNVKHPIQKDKFNCGVYVCLIIKQYISKNTNKIEFKNTEEDMIIFRKLIAETLDFNCIH